MLSFEQASKTILEHISALGTERLSLLESGGRVIAEDLLAPKQMPQWNNSAMDGYAVRCADCAPGETLKIRGYIPAGSIMTESIAAGTAAKIMTGAPIPPEADAIVPFENTSAHGETVTINKVVKIGDHIRFKGEDMNCGELVLSKGTILGAAEIAILASFNHMCIPVYRRPSVAIVSTGDELVEPDVHPSAGQIVNSNSFALATALREIGAQPILLGIARDNLSDHVMKLTEGLKVDALITTAGVSAGDRDFVRDALEVLNVEPIFCKVNIKPGRPTAFSINGNKPVFSLPGNPVSTIITFEILVKPALLKMMGHLQVVQPTFKATLLEDIKKKAGRTNFLRVIVVTDNGEYTATPAGDQNTGILKTSIRANALAILPAEPDFIAAGTKVDVHLTTGQYL